MSGCDVLEDGPRPPEGLTRGLWPRGGEAAVVRWKRTPAACPPWPRSRRFIRGRLEGDQCRRRIKLDGTAHLTAPIKVVSNLPYNVSTEILVRWLTPPRWPPAWQSLNADVPA